MKLQKVIFMVFTALAMTSSVSAVVVTADADGYADGANISNAFSGMTLSSTGTDTNLDGQVYARVPVNPGYASTGKLVFGNNLQGTDVSGSPFSEVWFDGAGPSFRFRADFDSPADVVSIDFIGNNHSDYGVLEAYSLVGTLLTSVSTPELAAGEIFSAQINRPSFDIAYIVASGISGDTVYLDNLCANVPEPATMVLLGLGGFVLRAKRKRNN